jgi:hypothetical protein
MVGVACRLAEELADERNVTVKRQVDDMTLPDKSFFPLISRLRAAPAYQDFCHFGVLFTDTMEKCLNAKAARTTSKAGQTVMQENADFHLLDQNQQRLLAGRICFAHICIRPKHSRTKSKDGRSGSFTAPMIFRALGGQYNFWMIER